MTQLTKTEFDIQTEALFPSNGVGAISALDLRTQINNLADSVPFKLTSQIAPPDANDDGVNSGGNGAVEIGDIWVDIVNNVAYICLDNAAAAAIWANLISGSSLTNEAVDDRVASLLVAGANVTLTYDDLANTITIASTGGGGTGSFTFGGSVMTGPSSMTLQGIDDAEFTTPGQISMSGDQSLVVGVTQARISVNDTMNTHALVLRDNGPLDSYGELYAPELYLYSNSIFTIDSGVQGVVINTLEVTSTGGLTFPDATTQTTAFTNEAVDDRVASLLVAGANVTLTYDDLANTITIASTGGGGGGGDTAYDHRFGFKTAPTSAEVIDTVPIVRNITIPANMTGSRGRVGTNPTNPFTMTLRRNGTAIGSITISTAGAVTFSTTGGLAQSLTNADVISLEAPASVDATIANMTVVILGETV